MLSSEALDFILKVTDYFHGHWEDPDWGRAPINEMLMLSATHVMLETVSDAQSRVAIQGEVEKAMMNVARRAAEGVG